MFLALEVVTLALALRVVALLTSLTAPFMLSKLLRDTDPSVGCSRAFRGGMKPP